MERRFRKTAGARSSGWKEGLYTDLRQHLFGCPKVVCKASFYRRSDAESLMYAAEVVVREVNRHGVGVLGDSLAKAMRQSGEPPLVHPHGQVLPRSYFY